MPTPLALALLFIESFAAYSLLRYFDVKSTKKLARRLDFQKHEVNPLLTMLARRWGLTAAFRITWLVMASGIASIDTFLGTLVSVGIPAAAFFFGTNHLLAAASNIQTDYLTRSMSREEIEAQTYKFARDLSSLSWKGRWTLLTKRYAFTFAGAIISLAAILLYLSSGVLFYATSFSIVATAMSNTASVEVGALLLFFPSIFFGTINWTKRLTKFYKSGKLPGFTGTGGHYVEVPVSVAEEALNVAKSKHASTVRLPINTMPQES